MSAPEKLLVRAPNWLGDCVMALPALDALRAVYPDALLVLACRPHLAPVFDAHPAVNVVHHCPSTSGILALRALVPNARRLRQHGFDTGVLLTNSFSTAFWMRLAGCRRRVGFRRDGRSWLLSDALPVTPELAAAHMARYYSHLTEYIGAEPATGMPSLRAPINGVAAATELSHRLGISGTPYALFAPVSAYGAVKDWPAERFAHIAQTLQKKHGLPVLITGTGSHRSACEAIATRAGEGVFAVAGDTDMAGFLGLAAGARLFVGNDSGGAHVAAAFGVPTVVLFGITEPSRTRPLGSRVSILGQGGVTTPDLRCPQVQRDAEAALKAITTEDVLQACDSWLKTEGARE